MVSVHRINSSKRVHIFCATRIAYIMVSVQPLAIHVHIYVDEISCVHDENICVTRHPYRTQAAMSRFSHTTRYAYVPCFQWLASNSMPHACSKSTSLPDTRKLSRAACHMSLCEMYTRSPCITQPGHHPPMSIYHPVLAAADVL